MDLIMQLNLKLTKLLCNVGEHNIITLRALMCICRVWVGHYEHTAMHPYAADDYDGEKSLI